MADVLVYDRLVIPVPAGDDDERWARNEWDVELQRRLIDVLRDGDQDRVFELPWDAQKRDQFKGRTADLASATAFDVATIRAATRDNPNTPAQYLTRAVIRDTVSAQRDEALVRHLGAGLPAQDVQVVAAYATGAEFLAETTAEPVVEATASGSDLLGGFVWPFLVPAEVDRSDADLLKRAVEFANEPAVQTYRKAYHQWRADMVLGDRSPREAAQLVRGQLDAYAEWATRTKVQTRVRTACTVVGVSAGVLTAIAFPLLGAPALAGSLIGGGAAGAGLIDLITTRTFRRPPSAPGLPGALFWEAQRRLQ